MRLRDASNETLKNSEPISDSVINESAKSSTACVIVSRRIAGGPTIADSMRDDSPRRALCPSADARATATSIADGAQSSSLRAEMKTSPGTSTRPIDFIFFLPSFCFSNNLRLRVMSPP
jgi:hypothetical protein